MSSPFEDAMHQGFSGADAAAEVREFEAFHGCIECEFYTPDHFSTLRCTKCDFSYKGGRS